MGPQDISRYRSWLLSNPSAFVEGVRGFCKQAAAARPVEKEEKSLWEKVKPWVIGLGAAGLGLWAGDKWGRFAQKHNYKYGPVRGPLVAGLGAFLPKDDRIDGTVTREEARRGEWQ